MAWALEIPLEIPLESRLETACRVPSCGLQRLLVVLSHEDIQVDFVARFWASPLDRSSSALALQTEQQRFVLSCFFLPNLLVVEEQLTIWFLSKAFANSWSKCDGRIYNFDIETVESFLGIFDKQGNRLSVPEGST